MVLYDPERRWIARAICDWDQDHGYFFPQSGPPGKRVPDKVRQRWDRAKEICAMCPVLAECKRDTLGEEWGVWGGLDQNQRQAVRGRLYQAAKKWPAQRRLAWGKELSKLRDGEVHWQTMRQQTGIPPQLAEELVKEWVAHEAARKPPPKVVDLALPEAPSRGPEFPTKPGKRHAWVRHNARISDAIYRGETPSGVWIFVTVYSGHGHVNKWVRRGDVQMYRKQPVVILTKRKEADEPVPECEPAA